VIEAVSPEIDGGRFPIKRVPGEEVRVEADVFADGHDLVSATLRFRGLGDEDPREVPMVPLGNDRYVATFEIEGLVEHRYTIVGWIDRFGSWSRDVRKKLDAEVDVGVDLLVGAQLVADAATRASGDDRTLLKEYAQRLGGDDVVDAESAAVAGRLADLMAR
jgi:starch synthase (maltosyl-transferring)